MKQIATTFLILMIWGISSAEPNFKVIDWGSPILMLYDTFHRQHLYYNYGARQDTWGGWQRNYEHDKPGDFFCEIWSQPKQIEDSTRNRIYQAYYNLLAHFPDSSLFGNLHWYSDTLTFRWLDSTETRNEYFLRYTDEKYVYVISGWWPNFIKIFRAYPSNVRIGLDTLIVEINSLLKEPLKITKTQLSEISDNKYFLVQGINDNYMVRYYNIKAYISDLNMAYSKEQPPMFAPRYSIIEITYYLNKDFIP
jgi:hypothetical protein